MSSVVVLRCRGPHSVLLSLFAIPILLSFAYRQRVARAVNGHRTRSVGVSPLLSWLAWFHRPNTFCGDLITKILLESCTPSTVESVVVTSLSRMTVFLLSRSLLLAYVSGESLQRKDSDPFSGGGGQTSCTVQVSSGHSWGSDWLNGRRV